MSCHCEFPIKAEDQRKGWSGEMSVSEYCAACGEAFGPDKHGKRKKAKKRKERAVAKFKALQMGDKIRVTKVLKPSECYTRSLWTNNLAEKLVPGRTYKYCGQYWWSRSAVFEEYAVPNTRKFRVTPDDIEYELLPRWWEA